MWQTFIKPIAKFQRVGLISAVKQKGILPGCDAASCVVAEVVNELVRFGFLL